MTKKQLQDDREDFRGGRNSAVSPDLLNPNELVDATNTRVNSAYGAFTKRTGTRRLHATAIGSGNPVTGVFQWDNNGTRQLVAVSNGNWYHKTSALGDFTQIVPATTFSTTGRQTFAAARASGSGAALKLYIAGNRLYGWDGVTLTVLAPAGLPTDIDIIAAMPTRLFARSISFKKTLYWSKVGDNESFTASGLLTDAGTALVGVLNGEEINSLEVVGGSLFIGAEDSLSRFSGVSTNDIQLQSDTFGLSSEIGPRGVLAMKRFETAAAILSERGPHVATEAGIAPIGIKVEPDFLSVTASDLGKAVVGYHRGRRELWFALPGTNDGGLNKTVYVYSTRLQAWMGPWSYSFGITSFARYEDSNGAENLVAGCSDGFVRLMDNVGGYKDDVLSDGTGGTNVSMSSEPAPTNFGSKTIKSLSGMELDADISASCALNVQTNFDGAGFTADAITTLGSGLLPYRVDLSGQGKRLRLKFTDASADAPVIYSYLLEAYEMNRR